MKYPYMDIFNLRNFALKYREKSDIIRLNIK